MTHPFRDGLAWLWLAMGIIGFALYYSVPARADDLGDTAWMWIQHHGTQFCDALHAHPDITGITTGAQAIIDAGFTPEETGGIAVWSTARFCPDYLPLLKRVAAQAERQALA